MNTDSLVAQIDAEIAKLQKAKSLLAKSFGGIRKVGRPRKNGNLSVPLSPKAKERIVAAQRTRWAKVKKTAKKA
jgi:hypothetical protein